MSYCVLLTLQIAGMFLVAGAFVFIGWLIGYEHALRDAAKAKGKTT